MADHRIDNIFDKGWHNESAHETVKKLFDEILQLSKDGELDECSLGEIFDDLYQEFDINFKDKILGS